MEQIGAEWKPGDREVKTVLEAHGLLPEGELLEEAMGLEFLYADRIRRLLEKVPAYNRERALLAIIEEGLMQEGLIPNSDERKFMMPAQQEH